MSIRHSPVRIHSAACAAVLALAAAAHASDTQVIADGSFGPNWLSQKIVDTTPGASATFTSTTQGGGVPGAYRDTSHTWSNGTILVAHHDQFQQQHNPAQIPICKIDFAADLIHFTGASVGGAVSYRLMVIQGGAYYGGPSIDVFDPFWASFVQNGLTAADFTLFAGSGPARPDFSCSGTHLQFGFITGNSASGGPVTKVSGIDNWTVTLHLTRVIWYDDALSAGNWTSFKLVDTTPGQTATTSSQQQPTGGASGPYRETTHTWSNGIIIVGHLNTLALHDPNVEPVHSVTLTAQLNHLTGLSVGGAVGFQVAVKQGPNWYGGPTIQQFAPSWTGHVMEVQPEDFNFLTGGPGRPDFAGGPLLEFGYLTWNSASGGPVTKVLGVDSLYIRANLAPMCTETVGATGCYGDDAGSPCPCFPAVPPGGPGRGCPNSVEPRGAKLVAFGAASISNDSVVLQGFGMTNSSCLYFQGAAFTPTLFGDGRRCAAGATIRLGTKMNVCTASQYPAGPDPSISTQGMVTAPGIRNYQVWYRNAAAFCTSSTFNLTNTVSINWGS